MATRASFIRSRFGRRLFGVFVLSAMIPLAGLAAVSYRQVSRELSTQAEERLHHAARATGQELVRRLLAQAEQLRSGAPGQGFLWVARARPGGAWAPVQGAPSELPGNAAAEERDTAFLLADGPSLVLSVAAPGGGRLAGEVDLDQLFDLSHENTLPTHGEFVVISGGQELASSLGGRPALLEEWRAEPERKLYSWDHEGQRFLAHPWSLFLHASFGAEPWTILVLEPRSVVMAPLAAFRSAFAAAVVLTVLLLPLLATRQIRRSLRPLEALSDGARRVAARDLGAEVEVDSDDEFGELALAFNGMSSALAGHFRALESLLEIDHELAAASDELNVLETVLRRIPELVDCRVCAFVPAPDEGEDAGPSDVLARSQRDSAPRTIVGVETDATSFARFALEPVAHHVLGAGSPGWLGWLRGEAASGVVLLRLRSADATIGMLLLGLDGAEAPEDEDLAYVRQLADQAAAIFSHLRERERRRILASYDTVTGLPNQRTFRERLGQTIRSAAPGEASVGVCLLAPQGLQRVDQALGHEVGEAVLRELAARLRRALPGGEVFRLGGADFAVILSELGQRREIHGLAKRLIDEVMRPFQPTGGDEVRLDGSAGIAVFPDDGHTAELLLSNADAAARTTTGSGRGAVRFYSAEGGADARARLRLESELCGAIERDELHLVYQPIVDVDSGDLIGAESLMRWNGPRGPVSPNDFIPVAEESGLVGELGAWALRRASETAGRWSHEGLPPIKVHVNVSAWQLGDLGLLPTIRDVLLSSGIPPRSLVLELTETMLTDGGDETVATLERIQALGVDLAIDDFGTGYASLGYLQRFPVSSLKIDRQFVEHVPASQPDVAIVRAVLGMARGLGLRVVAEGVETEANLAFLREEGCHEAQGYLFSVPLAEDEFLKLYRQRAAEGRVA